MVVVLDTNVVVSGLMSETSKPGKIIDLALENRFQVAYDDRILSEYEDVLARPELRIRPARARAVIAHIELTGQQVDSGTLPLECFQDPDDLPFAEVFITAKAQALVTGNLRHFSPLVERGYAVYSPAQFLERFFP
ncbi:MAG: putative toxin-antitoxin system toxin component, PIN family [Anaerolineaceae bacterium]|nr:putative toxin-antitoxin system toxin component, PIN family [Anaerolineaceae bacterium]